MNMKKAAAQAFKAEVKEMKQAAKAEIKEMKAEKKLVVQEIKAEIKDLHLEKKAIKKDIKAAGADASEGVQALMAVKQDIKALKFEKKDVKHGWNAPADDDSAPSGDAAGLYSTVFELKMDIKNLHHEKKDIKKDLRSLDGEDKAGAKAAIQDIKNEIKELKHEKKALKKGGLHDGDDTVQQDDDTSGSGSGADSDAPLYGDDPLNLPPVTEANMSANGTVEKASLLVEDLFYYAEQGMTLAVDGGSEDILLIDEAINSFITERTSNADYNIYKAEVEGKVLTISVDKDIFVDFVQIDAEQPV